MLWQEKSAGRYMPPYSLTSIKFYVSGRRDVGSNDSQRDISERQMPLLYDVMKAELGRDCFHACHWVVVPLCVEPSSVTLAKQA